MDRQGEILNILLYKWNVFNQEDIKDAIEKIGHYVTEYTEPEESKKSGQIDELITVIKDYDAVLSVNYFPRVSNACEEAGKKYIAWTVDSPLIAMHNKSVFNKCNYIFIFDKFNYMQFKQMGLEHLWYLPLAANSCRLEKLLYDTDRTELEKFDSDISFVGSLYHKNSYDSIKNKLSDYLRGYFDASILAQLDLYGDNLFDRMLTVEILEQLSEIVEFKNGEDSLSDLKLVFETTFLGYKLAQVERITCLNRLARCFNVDLYTDEADDSLCGVNVRGSVNYMNDMPKVFNRSKINLNFTIRNIRTGIPLRVWDILGAGGFLLTNYQPELTSFFENGKDIVFYDSIEDMVNKARYYLEHEDERKKIAQSGHEKVKKYHSYDIRIEEIFSKSFL